VIRKHYFHVSRNIFLFIIFYLNFLLNCDIAKFWEWDTLTDCCCSLLTSLMTHQSLGLYISWEMHIQFFCVGLLRIYFTVVIYTYYHWAFGNLETLSSEYISLSLSNGTSTDVSRHSMLYLAVCFAILVHETVNSYYFPMSLPCPVDHMICALSRQCTWDIRTLLF
jgi:hypothetical protein